MGQGQRKYEKEYKVQAVKLAQEIGAGSSKVTGDPGGYAVRVAEGGAGGPSGRRSRQPYAGDGDESGGGAGGAAQEGEGTLFVQHQNAGKPQSGLPAPLSE